MMSLNFLNTLYLMTNEYFCQFFIKRNIVGTKYKELTFLWKNKIISLKIKKKDYDYFAKVFVQ